MQPAYARVKVCVLLSSDLINLYVFVVFYKYITYTYYIYSNNEISYF
jgi:hypothetical protein